MRLCVELGLHRKPSDTSDLDPYTCELQKRTFWCAYVFDRCVEAIECYYCDSSLANVHLLVASR